MQEENHKKMEGQEETKKFFTNDRGVDIFCKHWNEELRNPKALVFIAHGLAEHCLYYEELALKLAEQGFYVFSHDHIGHGQTGGKCGFISDMRHVVSDVFQHIDSVKEKFPTLPVYIIGHSMGGCVTLLAALDRPDYFRGVLLIGPVVTPDPEAAGPVKIFFGKLFALIWPSMPVLWIKTEELTSNKEAQEAYKNDALTHKGGMKAITGVSILKAVQEIEAKLDTIEWPFLIIHGSQDRIVPSNGSKSLYIKASSKDKTLLLFDDCLHQPHREQGAVKEKTYHALIDWLVQRIQ